MNFLISFNIFNDFFVAFTKQRNRIKNYMISEQNIIKVNEKQVSCNVWGLGGREGGYSSNFILAVACGWEV